MQFQPSCRPETVSYCETTNYKVSSTLSVNDHFKTSVERNVEGCIGIKNMAEQTEKDGQKYRSLRNEFDDLQLEEKAVFLIESGLSLLIHSVESLTHFVRDEINKMADGDEEKTEEKKEEPKKKAAPKRKPRSTASKKTTSRSTPSKRKTPPKKDDTSNEGDSTT